jgi:hypothetical protein
LSGHNRTPRRYLQANLHGDINFREHTICWKHDSPSEDIRNWLGSLRPCDTVQLIPRARYMGWCNFVAAAEIEIIGEVSEGSSQLGSSTAGTVGTLAKYVHDSGIYCPLDQSRQEIRVIKIHPGLRDDDMICEIELVSLCDPQRTTYEGLSYVWGDLRNTKTVRMICSNTVPPNTQQRSVSVTANLYEALHYIRDDCRVRVFWIDAISINQNDVHERSQQVAMMRQIYSSATGVIVWLGLSNPEIQKSMDDARYVLSRYQEAIARSTPHPTTSELHHPMFENGWYHTDSQLFQKNWFSRAWVLQEVFNAKAVSVYCGDDVLPWSLVLRLNQCITRSMLIPNPIRKNVMSSLLAGLFVLKDDGDSDQQSTWVTRQGGLGILDAVIRGLDLDTTDPRDKLFALLCFGDETVDVSGLPTLISPDYTKSVSRVFADFTRWWMLTNRSLRILSSVHVSMGRTWQRLFPHYLPENSDRASWSIWHDGKAIWSRGTLGLLPHTPAYCASGSTTPDISLLDSSSSPMVLRLQGRIVTTIATIAPYPYYSRYIAPDELHTAYEELFDPVDARGTWKSVTLQADLLELQGRDTQQELMSKLSDHFQGHINYSSQTGAIECHHEAFFTTPNGKVGLCPESARIGDIIVVLDGGSVPYLLRAKRIEELEIKGGLQYHFVGECYLDGYMYGMAMQEDNEHGLLPVKVFDLV